MNKCSRKVFEKKIYILLLEIFMKKVLFIDDEPQNYSFMTDICNDATNSLYAANDVRTALGMVEEQVH